jgi:dsRNA-specific ribonuclease
VSDLLYRSLPSNATTGQLHDARAARVRREACAVAAKRLGLAPLLVVGKGCEGQEPTPAMLAGAAAAWLHVSARAVGSVPSCWHDSSWQQIASSNFQWLVMHGHVAGLL